jgi:hypothetical protein
MDRQSLRLANSKRGEELKTSLPFQAKSDNIIFKPKVFKA